MKNPFGNYSLLFTLAVISLTAVVPALMQCGFIDAGPITDELLLNVVVLGGGIVAGALWHPARLFSWRGAVVCAVYDLALFWATVGYTARRASFFKIELAVPLLAALIPAAVVYWLVRDRTPGEPGPAKQPGAPR